MKKLSIILLTLMVTLISCKTTVKETSTEAEGFIIKRGLNVSHWLSQTEMRGADREAYMQAEDFAKIAEMGFDHVRIPVDEMHLWDEDGKQHADAFKLLHNGIKWAFENDLRVIVDLHVLRSHHFNTGNQRLWTDPVAQKQFWGFWEQLSEELIQYPNDKLAYELMNEAVADDPDDWNKLIANGIKTVRVNEPERMIVVGSNKWQQVYNFKDLKIPENDKNLILSFHFYEPFIFTHYTAYWTGALSKYDGDVNYPGMTVDEAVYADYEGELLESMKVQNGDFNADVFEEKFMLAKKVADEYGLQLYCGEFGCFPSTPMDLRVELYKDYMKVFDKLDIAWTHWNYKNDFPVVDAETLEPIEEIVTALTK
jgi:endoglucanase